MSRLSWRGPAAGFRTIAPVVRTADYGLLGIEVDPGWPARPYVYGRTDTSTVALTRTPVVEGASKVGVSHTAAHEDQSEGFLGS